MIDQPVTVELRVDEGYRTTMSTALHTWVGDEKPSEEKPHPDGPNPFVQLLGALGSCMVMTVRVYAARKGWSVRTVRAELEGQREAGKPLASVNVTLHVEGDLDDAQRQRVLDVSQQCPVHKTLAPSVAIRTTLADEAPV